MFLPIHQPLHSFIFSPQMSFLQPFLAPNFYYCIRSFYYQLPQLHPLSFQDSLLWLSWAFLLITKLPKKKSSNTRILLSFSLHHSIHHVITLISLSLESIICIFNHYLAHTLNSLNILSCHCTHQEKKYQPQWTKFSLYAMATHTRVIWLDINTPPGWMVLLYYMTINCLGKLLFHSLAHSPK